MMTDYLLFVDDNEFLGSLMEMNLGDLGIPIKLAHSAEDAIKILREDIEHDIRAILVDILLPGMNGWELIDVIKDFRGDLGIVVLTADADSENKGKELVKCGKISAFFSKGNSGDQEKVLQSCADIMRV